MRLHVVQLCFTLEVVANRAESGGATSGECAGRRTHVALVSSGWIPAPRRAVFGRDPDDLQDILRSSIPGSQGSHADRDSCERDTYTKATPSLSRVQVDKADSGGRFCT